MIERLTNFEELEAFTKSSELGYKEATVEYYKQLGEKLGFTTRIDSSVIKHGLNLGKASLIWLEPNVVFFCEFGNFDEILKHLWKAVEMEPELVVLLLSSNSSCKPSYVKTLIDKSGSLENLKNKFLILDVSKPEFLKL